MSMIVRVHIAGVGTCDMNAPGTYHAEGIQWVLDQLEIEGQSWWVVPQRPRGTLMVRREAVTGVEVVA